VNWGEIYYATMRAVSREAAEQKAREIASLPIEIVGVGEDLALARQAAVFKATKRMAYADCFAAALAKLHSAELVTGDPEFRQLEGTLRLSGWRPADKGTGQHAERPPARQSQEYATTIEGHGVGKTACQ